MNKLTIILALVIHIFFLALLTPPTTQAQSCFPGFLPGDADINCKVDGLDFIIWFNNFGLTNTDQGASVGDFNDSQNVDVLDYISWLFNQGITAFPTPSLQPTAPVTPTIIPTTPASPSATPTDRLHIVYSGSDEDFANPERGFMKQSSIYLDQPFDPSKVRALEPSDTVVWIYFRLDNYRDPRDGPGVSLTNYQGKPLEPIGSGKGLDTVKDTFSEARKKGLKLVIRFIYNFGPDWTPDPMQANPDMPLNWVLQHINQLKPVIIENSDVILSIQIGFVGHWGEWHSSKYLTSLSDLKTIVEALLNSVPEERMLQIRYPSYKEIFFQGVLPESEAFTGSAKSRIGHHNDCFLRGQDDTTYKSTRSGHTSNYCSGQDEISCWKNFVAQEGQYTPVGGETCQPNPPRSDCANAQQEMGMLHWSFINNGYHLDVLNSWISGGCMSSIRRKLGYRLELKEAFIPKSIPLGGNLNLDIRLGNIGYAAMFNPRPAYLVLFSQNNRYEIPLSDIDPRRWQPGREHLLNINAKVPSDIIPGLYTLGLWLPDASATLRNNPAYAVRFANLNLWDSVNRINILTSNLEIK